MFGIGLLLLLQLIGAARQAGLLLGQRTFGLLGAWVVFDSDSTGEVPGREDALALLALAAAWEKHQVPQCGYCQAGQALTAAALLTRNADPDDAAIDSACRRLSDQLSDSSSG